jgi:hypothetical protein
MIHVPAAQVRNTRNAADFTERNHPRSSPEAYTVNSAIEESSSCLAVSFAGAQEGRMRKNLGAVLAVAMVALIMGIKTTSAQLIPNP